ncbi:porin [Paraburkholderia caffeinilytica]|uniref:Porin n=1 Tax=Paraburkholderia caffeinilytica TaxID=1761016 RepID=A0ABQ1LF20_9BURK|nr:porin [Paraburkholderia caffeinilytica]AXL51188.1 porin [Paraburkholderia caffeinilytica]GGC23942.1 porin [Paraburkholderia caffeinilytica]CAB3776729.1 hypothetical protein LMG28690_00270 [Paraburkholderia caffeinilytica]
MKAKITFAATIAVLTSGAHAESSVMLYGVIDSGFLYQTTSASSFAAKAPNTGSIVQLKDGGIYQSIWGLKGSEEIGNGYRVNFKLQGAFNSGNGKSGLGDTAGETAIFNQQSTVGISGPFGTFDAGRQFTPMIYAMAETDVRSAQYFGSILTAWLGMNQAAGWQGVSTNGPLGALWDSNALVYQSPKIYGVSLALEYAPGGIPGQIQGRTRESAVLKYANYGLNLSAIYYNGHDTNPSPTTVPAGVSNNRFYYLGAMYTFRSLSVAGSYGAGRNPANPGRVDYELVSVSVGYRVFPTLKLTSGYYHLKDRNDGANRSTELAMGAEYSLSKATLGYVQVGYVRNKGTMNQTITYGAPVAPGVSTTAAMIGVRHNF